MPTQFPPGEASSRWAELLAMGAGNLAYHAIHFGASRTDVTRLLGARFPNASWQTLDAVISRVRQAMLAGDAISNPTGTGTLALSSIPRSPLMPSSSRDGTTPAFQYQTNVESKVLGSRESLWTTVIIESDSQLNREQVHRKVLELWSGISEGLSGSARVRGNVHPMPTAIQVRMVWRS